MKVAALLQIIVLCRGVVQSSKKCRSGGTQSSNYPHVHASRDACRFEQLALGYDEDDIGSLADDDPDIAGDTGVDEFSDALVTLKPHADTAQCLMRTHLAL